MILSVLVGGIGKPPLDETTICLLELGRIRILEILINGTMILETGPPEDDPETAETENIGTTMTKVGDLELVQLQNIVHLVRSRENHVGAATSGAGPNSGFAGASAADVSNMLSFMKMFQQFQQKTSTDM